MHKEMPALIEAIKSASNILLICHVQPDGDTVGSALALRLAFKALGKSVTIVCDQPVPRLVAFLFSAGEVRTPEPLAGRSFDLALAVDVGDRGRMGTAKSLFDASTVQAVLDHHATNPGFGHINVVVSPLSATAILACEVIDRLGVAMTIPMYECLFAAVATDTGGFRQRNTDAQALQLSMRVLSNYVNIAEISRILFETKTLSQVRLATKALSTLRMSENGHVAMMTLANADFATTGATGEDTEGLVNQAGMIKGVLIACLLSEQSGVVRGSLRSRAPIDIAQVALALGGGGHAQAAGFTLHMPIELAMEQVWTRLMQADVHK